MNQIFSRNSGYIDADTQQKIFKSKILIAGCGIGSQIALAAARMGIHHFILVDGDEVELTNLNRQAYSYNDVKKYKTEALKEKLLEINPQINIQCFSTYLNHENARKIVELCDIVIDTIDFLDLPAILELHHQANILGKPVLSGFSAGWGCALVYAQPNPNKPSLISEIFNIKQMGNLSYVEVFKNFFKKLVGHLPEAVQNDMNQVLIKMQDNQPCPASHVISGTLCLAALANTALYQIIKGQSIMHSEMILIDLEKMISMPGIVLTDS